MLANKILIGSGSAEPYWQLTLIPASGAVDGDAVRTTNPIATDDEGNCYLCYHQGNTSISMLAKVDRSGNVVWYNELTITGRLHANGLYYRDGYVYVAMADQNASPNYSIVGKFNASTGAKVWCTSVTDNGADATYAGGVVANSSGDVFAAVGIGNTKLPALMKFDSAGNFVSQYSLASGNDVYSSPVLLSGGNVVITTLHTDNKGQWITADYSTSNPSIDSANTKRFDFSGSVQHKPHCVLADSSDNLYIIGKVADSGTQTSGGIMKTTTGGTVSWSSSNDKVDEYYAGALDETGGYVYALGGASTATHLRVYDTSSGTALYHRRFTGLDVQKNAGVALHPASSSMYICGLDNNNDFVLHKLPMDGSGLGTYGLIDYENYTASVDTTGSVSITNSSTSKTSNACTASTTTLTEDQAGSVFLSVTLVDIYP